MRNDGASIRIDAVSKPLGGHGLGSLSGYAPITDEGLAPSSYHPVRYWRQEAHDGLQNFGDYLGELFISELLTVPVCPADAYHLIGSTIDEWTMRRDFAHLNISPNEGKVAYWGCGAREYGPISRWVSQHARFFGVRGPKTRDVLGLPDDTVLGDPGLLAPLIRPKPACGHGRTLCITHFEEPRDAADIKRQTGVDRVISAAIPGDRAALLGLIDEIAGADFVLSGALHGAILACAYGAPFSYFDSGFIDVPFKWADFAASINVPGLFATTLKQGREIYAETIAPAYRPLPLTPLLAACPFGVRHAAIFQALHHDGRMDQPRLDGLMESLGAEALNLPEFAAAAQERWLSRERGRYVRRLAAMS